MKMRLFAALGLLMAAVAAPLASDPVSVYAKVDRVVLEPDGEAPTAIQVWGVFSIAAATRGSDYQPAARGYPYFNVGRNAVMARREWNDLKQVAGTGQVVAFGTRWDGVPRLRPAAEKPAN